MVQADDIPEGAEVVTITLVNVTTMGVQDQAKGAVIDTNKKMAILTVLPNDSPYGVISWHLDSANISLLEPECKFSFVAVGDSSLCCFRDPCILVYL